MQLQKAWGICWKGVGVCGGRQGIHESKRDGFETRGWLESVREMGQVQRGDVAPSCLLFVVCCLLFVVCCECRFPRC